MSAALRAVPADAEWLQPDGSGGFASGTVGLIRTRRYHALLLTCMTPPTGRVVLVNGLEAWIERPGGSQPLSSQRYAPDVVHPDLAGRILEFSHEPWPRWVFGLADGKTVEQELLVDTACGDTILRWRTSAADGVLHVRPLLSGRDYHSLHRENSGFDFRATVCGGSVAWRPYADRPAIACLTNAAYRHDPAWFRQFLYTAERERGLDCIEDLASPGEFVWPAGTTEAVMVLRPGDGLAVRPVAYVARVMAAEQARRAAWPDRLAFAADAYLVDRGAGSSIVAGYPWFTDWGRDTFIALRGLLLATGRIAQAETVLLEWSGQVSEGMLPNRFADGDAPEFNTADASLWFCVAVHDLLLQPGLAAATPARLRSAVEAILDGHLRGTRFGIAVDSDGLLRAGVPGQQLTWMDAKVGDWVVTPRIGKPVEINALWFNALRIAAAWNPAYAAHAARAQQSFAARFPDPATGGLLDVVDCDHVAGAVDAAVRPNQIFAVGGLPFALLEGPAAQAVVDLVERELLTPMGLRTLSPSDPAYRPRYAGSPLERDGAYHQGTVWPWLIGPFVEAWLRTHGDTPSLRAAAKDRFLTPLLDHVGRAGLGHVSEVADADAPHTPGGCPFQAWSVGELLRAFRMTDKG
jgi:predicted glycogen debranching enzyme